MPGNILNLDPAVIASWPTPNYVDPPERTWLPLACGIMYGFSTLTLSLRLWLRMRKQAGGFGFDDAMLALAWLGSTVFTVVEIINSVEYHLGRHVWDIPIPYFEKIVLIAWIGELTFLWTGSCTKISVLLFYRRIVGATYTKRWKWAIIAAIVFTASWTVAFILMLFANCQPMDAYWRAFNPEYKVQFTCVDTTVINLIAGVFAISGDLYAVALPFVITRHLQISRKARLLLNVLFSSGLAVAAIGGVRTYYLWQVGHNPDVSRMIFEVSFWAQMEIQLSILLACLPALRAFFRRYINSTFVRSSENSNDSGFQKHPHTSKSRDHSILVTKDTELEIECAGIDSPDSVDKRASPEGDEVKLWRTNPVPLCSPVAKIGDGRFIGLAETRNFTMYDSRSQRWGVRTMPEG